MPGSTASCATRATPPSASSTTSGSRRRTLPPKRRPRQASSSCCSTSPTRAAGSSASGRSRSPPISASSRSCATRASASASPPTPCARARATGSKSSAATQSEHALPLHVHADEQPREIEECLAEHGVRPIELLADCGCLGPRSTIVHATHADGRELDLLAESGSRICACPTTEANLGDGFLPVERVLHRGIRLCIGSDSNARIDPFEELRELDGIARRQSGPPRRLHRRCAACDRHGGGRGLARARRVAADRDRPRARAASRCGRAGRRARLELLRRRRQATRRELARERDLGVAERAPLLAIDLDEPPRVPVELEREHDERAEAVVAEDDAPRPDRDPDRRA